MTEQELILMERLGECASIYSLLMHDYAFERYGDRKLGIDGDINEFVAHIHDLQARVALFSARRDHPDRIR